MHQPFDSTNMSLAQKIGQVLMIGFDGITLTPELRAMITDVHVGGIILFARNIAAPQQVAQLTSAIQQAAHESGNPGLFIAIDQEGGRVARLTEATGFSEFPSAMAVAATGDTETAFAVGQAMAAEMRAVGINVDFAPDLDTNNNPANPVIGTRSYGSDPAQVAAFGVAALRGVQAGGLLAFGKHFPGHGDTDTDSHVALPTVAHARARLEQIELVPFRAAIAAGVAGIMSAHVTFPAIEPRAGVPATLSAAVLTNMLRGELGFDGLIVTDSLEMGALATSGYTPAQAAAAALAAGADVLLFNNGYDDHRAAHTLIAARVAAGAIPAAQLDAAVARIMRAKAQYGILDAATPAAGLIGSAEQRGFARAVALRSFTLLRNDGALLPLADRDAPQVIEPTGAGLGAALGMATLALDSVPTADQRAAVAMAAQAGSTLIIGLSAMAQKPEQAALVAQLLAQHERIVLVALRDPYDLLLFPAARAMLATYAAPAALLGALRGLLNGDVPPRGRLPVELPGMFTIGTGQTAFS